MPATTVTSPQRAELYAAWAQLLDTILPPADADPDPVPAATESPAPAVRGS